MTMQLSASICGSLALFSCPSSLGLVINYSMQASNRNLLLPRSFECLPYISLPPPPGMQITIRYDMKDISVLLSSLALSYSAVHRALEPFPYRLHVVPSQFT